LRYIKLIEDEFGDLPIAALADRRIRGEFKSWRDKYSNTPRKADLAWTVLACILSFAKDRGIITSPPVSAVVGCISRTAETRSGPSRTLPQFYQLHLKRSGWR
jgi:hypothetical protein